MGEAEAARSDRLDGVPWNRPEVNERHRHRYEVNNNYVPQRKPGAAVPRALRSSHLPEIMELPSHRVLMGVRSYPELPRIGSSDTRC